MSPDMYIKTPELGKERKEQLKLNIYIYKYKETLLKWMVVKVKTQTWCFQFLYLQVLMIKELFDCSGLLKSEKSLVLNMDSELLM